MKGTFFYLLQKYTEFNPHSDMDIGITSCSDGTPHNNILCSSPTPSWSGSKSTALQYEYSMRQTQMATWRLSYSCPQSFSLIPGEIYLWRNKNEKRERQIMRKIQNLTNTV